MKKITTFSLLLIVALLLVGCGSTSARQQTPPEATSTNKAQAAAPAKKTLILYYSHTGNTRELAEQIRQKTGADIVEIRTVRPYPTVYNELTEQAKREQNSGFRPPIQPLNINIAEYDTIFIGSPIWWSTIATPVTTFLSEQNMAGKTLIPFVTHGGSGLARTVNAIKELAPQANVRDGLAIRSSNVKSAQKDIDSWLYQVYFK